LGQNVQALRKFHLLIYYSVSLSLFNDIISSLKYDQQDVTFSLFISINCSTGFRRFLRPSSGAQNYTYSVRYCQTNTAAYCYRWWSFISSTIAAASSIGLTIPDAVCTLLCSWWWAERPPETCRAIYRNK